MFISLKMDTQVCTTYNITLCFILSMPWMMTWPKPVNIKKKNNNSQNKYLNTSTIKLTIYVICLLTVFGFN